MTAFLIGVLLAVAAAVTATTTQAPTQKPPAQNAPAQLDTTIQKWTGDLPRHDEEAAW